MSELAQSPAPTDAEEARAVARLREIMRRLRDPAQGCPWDIEQDFRSISAYTIEEAYEVADAIERGDLAHLADELGDLLLQVVYHAQMAEETGAFTFGEVVNGIAAKMIRRHPHVFGAESRDRSAAEQTAAWEAIKAGERGARGPSSALDSVPVGLPGLTRAVKLQRRAARVGFDWPVIDQVVEKIGEEARELAAERGGARERLEDEFGDLLFAVVNLGRWLEIDPETAMRRANAKFERRFRAVERGLAARGASPETASLEEMEALWIDAKSAERR